MINTKMRRGLEHLSGEERLWEMKKTSLWQLLVAPVIIQNLVIDNNKTHIEARN